MKRILVVDDNRNSMKSIVRLLKGGDDYVMGMTSGVVAVTTMKANPLPFDVLITDLEMPDMNGVELVSFARDHGVSKIVIMTAAVGTPGELGIPPNVGVLRKPFDGETLRKMLGVTK